VPGKVVSQALIHTLIQPAEPRQSRHSLAAPQGPKVISRG
jgi:hypothetical protein